MKVAVLLERGNFERYSPPEIIPDGVEIIHFGNRTPNEDEIAASGASVIIADPMVPVRAELIERMPGLKLIQSQGVAYNLFDVKAARDKGVKVANCAGANAGAVAEQAILLMLAVLRNVKEFDKMVYSAKQAEAKQQCFQNGIRELGDCHVGLLGFGAIGREVSARLFSFGSRVSYYDLVKNPDSNAEYMSMEQIIAECDIISLHLPVTEQTTGLVNDDMLAKMKQNAILINTARGEIVDQQALCRALTSGKLGGAGLDTLSPEPVTADNPLLSLPEEVRARVVLSPHIGGITEGSFRRYYKIIWNNVRLTAEGKEPVNVVN